MRALCLLVPALLVVADRRESLAPRADGNDRIIGGKPAFRGQFPYQALLTIDYVYMCSGSLITRTTVLTAAHCTMWRKEFVVKLGVIDRELEVPEIYSWTVVSPLAMEHPHYHVDHNTDGSTRALHFDVALIFLPHPAPLTRFINLVALPSIYEVHNSFVGENAIISGWGWMNASVPARAGQLQWTEMTVIPNGICEAINFGLNITEWHLCAYNQYSTACSGDSGGPLVLKIGGRYKQIGVASLVMRTCPVGWPNVFARVTSVIAWIKFKSQGSV